MARITLDEFEQFGAVDGIQKSWWRVYANKDSKKGDLIFESKDDDVNVYSISMTLKNPDGTLYEPHLGSIAEVQVMVNNKYGQIHNLRCNVHNRLPSPFPVELN